MLVELPSTLRAAQKVFATTGGSHAAGLFTAGGDALVVREDVGRHHAIDKVIGCATERDRVPLAGTILLVSGRASFELVQKSRDGWHFDAGPTDQIKPDSAIGGARRLVEDDSLGSIVGTVPEVARWQAN